MQAKNNRLLLAARFVAIFPASGSARLDRKDFLPMIIFRIIGFSFFEATCNQRIFLSSLYMKQKEINLFLSYDKATTISCEVNQ